MKLGGEPEGLGSVADDEDECVWYIVLAWAPLSQNVDEGRNTSGDGFRLRRVVCEYTSNEDVYRSTYRLRR